MQTDNRRLITLFVWTVLWICKPVQQHHTSLRGKIGNWKNIMFMTCILLILCNSICFLIWFALHSKQNKRTVWRPAGPVSMTPHNKRPVFFSIVQGSCLPRPPWTSSPASRWKQWVTPAATSCSASRTTTVSKLLRNHKCFVGPRDESERKGEIIF